MQRKCLWLVLLLITTVVIAEETTIPTIIIEAEEDAHIAERTLGDAVTKVTVSESDIQATGASELSQLIHSKSGLVIRDLYNNGRQTSFSLRGFGENSGSNTKLLVDGLPINNPDLGSLNLNSWMLESVQQIEIQASSSGVLYGNEAVGGVVNIITKPIEDNAIQVNATVGTYNTQQYGASLSQRFNNDWAYRLSASYQESDNYRRHNHYQLKQAGVRTERSLPQGKLFINYHVMDDASELPGAITLAQASVDPRQARSYSDVGHVTNHHAQVGIEQMLNSHWQLKWDAAYRFSQGEGILTNRYHDQRNSFSSRIKTEGIMNWRDQSHKLIAGMDVVDGRYQFSSDSYQTGSRLFELSAFVYAHYALSDDHELIAGWRSAYHRVKLTSTASSNNNTAHINEIGWRWIINPMQELYVKRAESYRFAKADENALTENNKPLRPQTGVSYEAGWRQLSDKTELLLSAYYLLLNNEISYVPALDGRGFGANKNLSPTKRLGVLGFIEYEFNEQWQASLHANVVDAKFNEGRLNNKRIPLVPDYNIRASLAYRWLPNTILYLESITVGRYAAGNDTANQSAGVPAYTVFNTHVHWEKEPFTLGLRVNNIFDRRYYNSAFYTLDPDDNTFKTFVYPAAGRQLLLSLQVAL